MKLKFYIGLLCALSLIGCRDCEEDTLYRHTSRITGTSWDDCSSREEFDQKIIDSFRLGIEEKDLRAELDSRGWLDTCEDCLRREDEGLWVFTTVSETGEAYDVFFYFGDSMELSKVTVGIGWNPP